MAWETLIEAVEAVITDNDNKEITGEVLRDLITNNIIPQLGAAKFKGVATPITNPGTQESEVFYIAKTKGIYTNFNVLEVNNDELVVLRYVGGSWQKTTLLTDIDPKKITKNFLSKDAYGVKNNADGIMDIWFDEDSIIPTGYNLFLWFILQPPASGVVKPTIYIVKGTTEVPSTGVEIVAQYIDPIEAVKTGVEEIKFTTASNSGVKLKAIVDWDKILPSETGSSLTSKIDISYLKKSAIQKNKEKLTEIAPEDNSLQVFTNDMSLNTYYGGAEIFFKANSLVNLYLKANETGDVRIGFFTLEGTTLIERHSFDYTVISTGVQSIELLSFNLPDFSNFGNIYVLVKNLTNPECLQFKNGGLLSTMWILGSTNVQNDYPNFSATFPVWVSKLNTDISDSISNGLRNGSSTGYAWENNLPILSNHIFLRSDKTTPIFKNSCFTKTDYLYQVDLTLATPRKSFNVLEPLNISEDVSGLAKWYLSRNSDPENLIFKDVLISYKDVSTITSNSVKIMSLGDSLTEGLEWDDTPVSMLTDELTEIGVSVDYVGSLVRNYVNKQGQTVTIKYEGRGGWRYRTLTGLESRFAGLNAEIPTSPTKSEWVLGVDGASMNDIKKYNPFLYPATAQDKIDYPDFCFNYVNGNTSYNISYSQDDSLGDYVIFDPVRYFSERNIDVPDILTIAYGTNEWYLGGWDLPTALNHAEFIFKRFREVSSSLKIVVIPANALNVGRQQQWNERASILTSGVMKKCENLISNGDSNLFVCPIFLNSSRTLAFDNLTSVSENLTVNNSVQKAEISDNVHSFYVDDESNNQYADSLASCIVNLID